MFTDIFTVWVIDRRDRHELEEAPSATPSIVSRKLSPNNSGHDAERNKGDFESPSKRRRTDPGCSSEASSSSSRIGEATRLMAAPSSGPGGLFSSETSEQML